MPTSHYTSTYGAGIGCMNNFLRKRQKRSPSMRIRFQSSLRRDKHLFLFRWNQYCYRCNAWMAQNAKDTSVDAIGEGLFNVLIMQRSDMVLWLKLFTDTTFQDCSHS